MDHKNAPRCFSFSALVLIACLMLQAGCSVFPSTETTGSAPTPTPIVVTSIDSSTPITVTLTLSLAPRLGQAADLKFTFKTIADAPGTQAEVVLPDGALLDSGVVKWAGDLKAGEPVTLQATIHFTKEGNFALEGKALCKQANGDVWGDSADIYLQVTQAAGLVGFSVERTPIQAGQQKETPPSANPAP
jgi:hypothetical protein